MQQLTFVMTVWPSWAATHSFTLEGGAFSSLFPPMKWSAILCFSAYEALPFGTGAVTLLPLRCREVFAAGVLLFDSAIVKAACRGGKDEESGVRQVEDSRAGRSHEMRRGYGERVGKLRKKTGVWPASSLGEATRWRRLASVGGWMLQGFAGVGTSEFHSFLPRTRFRRRWAGLGARLFRTGTAGPGGYRILNCWAACQGPQRQCRVERPG